MKNNKMNDAMSVKKNNDLLFYQKIILIDENGTNQGTVNTTEALNAAIDDGLDLVLVGKQTDTVPTCRIMNYNKWKYQRDKKLHKQKVCNRRATTKQIRFNINIDEADYNRKIKNISKFINKNHRVIVNIVMGGRQITHPDLATTMAQRIIDDTETFSTASSPTFSKNNVISFTLQPHTD